MASFILTMASLNDVMISTILIILMVIPSVISLSFNFTDFTPDDGNLISYEALAYAANDAIQLTVNKRGPIPEGRATYTFPLHLWDRASRYMVDFETHFSFSIYSLNSSTYGDGMVFFIAPNGSKVPEDPVSAGGGNLGLSTYDPFVAVEFDIAKNDWDPPYNHVGIDINSMKSATYQRWWSNTSIMQGRRQEATIKYTAQSNNLSVVFTYWGDDMSWLTQELSYTVDLRDNLPEFVTFGFSAAIGVSTALHTIYSWSFSSNLIPGDPGEVIGSKSESFRLIGYVIGGLVFVLLLVLFMYYFWKKRKCCFRNVNRETQAGVYETTTPVQFAYDNLSDGTSDFADGESSRLSEICDRIQQDAGPKQFTYDDLRNATDNFADDKILGRGGFGCVYQGHLDGIYSNIAVKRIYSNIEEGENGYAAEVMTISKLSHKNLVQLFGWCHEKRRELLLVYEFVPYGSLDSHLFNRPSLLTWGIRLQIAKDLALVLHYLHESCRTCVLHRDIKSNNVMLGADLKVKLGDFGLARLVDHDKGSYTTNPAGTIGYMAPELLLEGAKASKATDVYSFGVVALEIATGKRAIHSRAEQGRVNLVEWVWSMYAAGRLDEAADHAIVSDQNMGEVVRMMTVGLWCASQSRNSRPSILEAALMLSGGQLPVLTSLGYSSQYVTAVSSASSMSGDTTGSSKLTESFSGASL